MTDEMPTFIVVVKQEVTYSLAVQAPTADAAAALVNRERVDGTYGLDRYHDEDDCHFYVRRADKDEVRTTQLEYDQEYNGTTDELERQYGIDYTLEG